MKGIGVRQAGLSIVEVAIAVAVIGIIGVAGRFVYQQNKPKATNATANTNQSTNEQNSTTTTQTNTDPYEDRQTYNGIGL